MILLMSYQENYHWKCVCFQSILGWDYSVRLIESKKSQSHFCCCMYTIASGELKQNSRLKTTTNVTFWNLLFISYLHVDWKTKDLQRVYCLKRFFLLSWFIVCWCCILLFILILSISSDYKSYFSFDQLI